MLRLSAALTLNVSSNIFLIPRFGISGAALANGLSYGTAALVLLVAFIRDSGHSVAETLLVRPAEIGEMARATRPDPLARPRRLAPTKVARREHPGRLGPGRSRRGGSGASRDRSCHGHVPVTWDGFLLRYCVESFFFTATAGKVAQ
jgi:hypothetical protein